MLFRKKYFCIDTLWLVSYEFNTDFSYFPVFVKTVHVKNKHLNENKNLNDRLVDPEVGSIPKLT